MTLRARVRRAVGRPATPDAAHGPDAGMALVFVVTTMLVLGMLLTAVLAYAVSSQDFSRRDQDYAGAMAAAQGGVDDFLGRLNRNDDYARRPDCSNEALAGPTTRPNPCGWTTATATGWLPVDVSDVTTAAGWFHYRADASKQDTESVVTITSTGRVNGVHRTIEVTVGKGGSTDYLYYTDFESLDPALSRTSRPECGADGGGSARYSWQGRSGCTEIRFTTDDVVEGRLFTNDSVLSQGGRFLDGIESAHPGCRDVLAEDANTWDRCLRTGSTHTATGTTATFGTAPAYANPLYLPDNSAAFADLPGCHYVGATRIVFDADGTMTVWSKNSSSRGSALAVPDASGARPDCGTGSGLASASGATVPVPSDMVVHVEGAPTSVPRRQCHADSIGGPPGQELPLGTYDAGTPTRPTGADRFTFDVHMAQPAKYCGEGNVYVQGVVKGRVTVAAAQSVVLTGDLVLADGIAGKDIIGLVAANAVEVMHPVLATISSAEECTVAGCTWRWGAPSGAGEAGAGAYAEEGAWPVRVADPVTGAHDPPTGIQVAASIQALQHSFFVPSWQYGPAKGVLKVRGSIAQRWRGPVGASDSSGDQSGYDKDYGYDPRLQDSAPPFFPHWANSEWALETSGEIPTPTAVRTS